MTVQEIVNRINSDLDMSEVFSDVELAGIVLEGLVDVCMETECLTKSDTSTVTALEPLIGLPSDHLRTVQFRWSYNQQLHTRTFDVLDEEEDDWVFEVSTPENVLYTNYDNIRLHPNPSAAGTVTHRYAYYPTAIQLSDEPEIQNVFHQALVDYGVHACALILREYELAGERWTKYKASRDRIKASSTQKPKVMVTVRPVTTWNYSKWDWGIR